MKRDRNVTYNSGMGRFRTGRAFFVLTGVLMIAAACAHRPVLKPKTAKVQQPFGIEKQFPVIQYTVQVGAFVKAERAAAYEKQLKAAGVDAYRFIHNDGLWKVRFEHFATAAAARKRAKLLKKKGVINDFLIVRPLPDTGSGDHLQDLRDNIVKTARRFMGTPYVYGGASPQQGFDCSGFTMTVYRLNGLELPRSASAQFRIGAPVSRQSLQNGDLLFFATGSGNRISHVGIYSGNGRFIHASTQDDCIRTASLTSAYFKKRYRGARRFVP